MNNILNATSTNLTFKTPTIAVDRAGSRRSWSRNKFELEPRLVEMKRALRDGHYKQYRTSPEVDLLAECDAEQLSWPQRAARLIRRMCKAQKVIIRPEERIVFTRTTGKVPPVYSESQHRALTSGYELHELGPVSNVCADWEMVLSQGLWSRRKVALSTRERLKNDPKAVEFLDGAVETIDAVVDLAWRYAQEASRNKRHDIAKILYRVPAQPASTFHEALQALRLCHAVLWMGGHYHCGLGRFDQYMWPYLKADLAMGRLDVAGRNNCWRNFSCP